MSSLDAQLVPRPLDPETDAYPCGPEQLVLVGPPGTGKTRAVLDLWLAPAVQDGDPKEVLGCSFTKAAAREMLSRLADQTGVDGTTLRQVCRTIHSESLRIVRDSGRPCEVFDERTRRKKGKEGEEEEEIGGDWESLSNPERDLEAEARRVWTLARHRFPLEHLHGEPVERLISRVIRHDSTFRIDHLSAVVRDLEVRKQTAGQIDFTDMLLGALQLWSPRRRLIVVDEAQDLSPLQILLVQHWAEKAEQLVWVGDPDQGIYAFAGADGHHLTGLIRSGVPARRLRRSWRVPVAVHDLARSLILQNRQRIDAPYDPGDRRGDVLELHDQVEAARLCAQERGECFVLARIARALDPYATWLADQGIPFIRERGGPSPLRQTGLVKLVLALHHLVAGHLAPRSAALELVDQLPGRPAGRFFRGTKKACLAALKAETALEVGRTEIEEAGAKLGQLLPATPGDWRHVALALEALGLAEETEGHLRILRNFGPDGLTRTPRIRLTTIHSAKGREADLVVLDLATTRPTQQEIAATSTGEEGERRVLYVGLTRTRDRLVLVRAPATSDLGNLLGLKSVYRYMKMVS